MTASLRFEFSASSFKCDLVASSLFCLFLFLEGNGKFTFTALDSKIIESVPPHIRGRLPRIITPKVAVEDTVVELIERDVVSGKSIQDLADTFKELQAARIYKLMDLYYDIHKHGAQRPPSRGQSTLHGFINREPAKIEPFPPINSQAGYKIGLGRKAITNYFLESFKLKALYYARTYAGLGGRVQRADHTFKAMKRVTAADGGRVFEAVFDVMNEYAQITMLLFTTTTSLEEVMNNLTALADAWSEVQAQVSA